MVGALETEAENVSNNKIHVNLGLVGKLPKPRTAKATAVID